jgi:serine/threonine protein phosphatase 1
VRYLAIGDIHGCFAALEALVQYAPYDEAETVVFLGDYVDRGPRSREVLDWLIGQQKRRRIVALRGNHDIMMCQAREEDLAFYDWLHFGGDETLRSYGTGGLSGRLDDVPEAHWQFLEATVPIFQVENDFFVHAGVDPRRPLDDQPDDLLYWEKLDETAGPHVSGKRMICGHTSQHSGVPLDLGHAVCIDTWVYGAGWLTALDVETGRCWQANEYGMTRTGSL